MNKIKQVKTQHNQQVTSKRAPIVISKGLFSYRFIGLKDLFECITLDNKIYYNYNINLDSTWYYNKTLQKVYRYNSIYMNFQFREEDLPKRCVQYHKELTTEVYQYLKSEGSRVSTSKLRLAVKHLVKHISRLKFHKKYAIRYTRNPKHWREYGKNLSWVYMDKVLSYLVDKGDIKNYTGGVTCSSEDICSIFIVNPELINRCTGCGDGVLDIEPCLLPPEVPLVEIRDENKKPRKPNKEERIEVNNMEMVAKQYSTLLSKRTISINGISVPELFFRRIATIDLLHGCRWYDDGSIQKEDATSRSSVIIDGEETVEVDYSSLHFCLAAEELGLDLKGKDPYNFPFEVTVDTDVVERWRSDYGFTEKYDPVRNLKKTALLTMFNATSESSAISAISKALMKDYRKQEPVKRKFVGITNVQVKLLVKALREHNLEISNYLTSGVGLRFQKADSNMMTYCIERFMEKNEVCIPIHDSLIVKKSMKTFAEDCMTDAYEFVMGSKINCKVK